MLLSFSLIPYRLAMDKLTKKAKGNSLPSGTQKSHKKEHADAVSAYSLKTVFFFDRQL